MNNEQHHKRIVVISGGTGYVGRETVKELAEHGMVVAVVCRQEKENEARRLVATLSGQGHQVYVCDISKDEEVSDTLRCLEEEMGQLFACVHIAGTKPIRKHLTNTTRKEFEEAFLVNTFGAFSFISGCAKILKKHKRGVIIGVTTAGVVTPKATNALGGYVPAKYAVQGMLTMLKEEMNSLPVRVYSVAPGFMAGGMNEDIPQAFVEILRKASPHNSLATAESVAQKIRYLCSDESAHDETLTHLVAPEYE